jgi:hypothetical protein
VKLLGNGDDAQSGTNSIRFLGVLNLGGTNLSLFPNCARVGVRVVLLENTSTFWAFLFLRGPNSITAAIAYGIPVKYAAPAINPHKIRYRREFGVPDISLRECGFFPETRAELLRYPAPSEVSEPEGRGELSYGIFQWRHTGTCIQRCGLRRGENLDQARIARTSRYSAATLVLPSDAVLCSAHNDSSRDANSAWLVASSRENVT